MKIRKRQCEHCGNFYHRQTWVHHLISCITDCGERKLKCDYENCPTTFRTVVDLRAHVFAVHKLPVRCPREGCNIYLKPTHVASHIRKVHDKVKIACCKCGKEIPREDHENHEKLCDVSQKTYRCTYEGCNRLLNPSSMWKHIRAVHQKIKRECPNCGKLLQVNSLPTHLKICSNANQDKVYKCQVPGCHSRFRVPYEIKCHIWKVHRVTHPYLVNVKGKCDMCGSEMLLNNLERHVKICTYRKDKNDFVCRFNGCQVTFRCLAEKNKHIRKIHSMPIPCIFKGCFVNVKFYHMANHIRTVHFEEDTECSYCGKEFVFDDYNYHIVNCVKDLVPDSKPDDDEENMDVKPKFNAQISIHEIGPGMKLFDNVSCDMKRFAVDAIS